MFHRSFLRPSSGPEWTNVCFGHSLEGVMTEPSPVTLSGEFDATYWRSRLKDLEKQEREAVKRLQAMREAKWAAVVASRQRH